MTHINFAGIDLAWRSENNPSALAIGSLVGAELTVCDVIHETFSVENLVAKIAQFPMLRGIAIDAPLIIMNQKGQRDCENLIGKEYGARGASCHSSNLSLFPDADSVKLSRELAIKGFQHLGLITDKWQIECYPHPALIEIFNLPKILRYKKPPVDCQRAGQAELGRLLTSLEGSNVLRLKIPSDFSRYTDSKCIESLKGKKLKKNEDILDSIVCLYIAALYTLAPKEEVFGSQPGEGYIYVPKMACLSCGN